jgi:hypothetical protein
MTAYVNDIHLDNGLSYLKSNADKIFICTAQPTTYTDATSTYALGSKNFGAGSVFPNAIVAGSPSGQKLTTAAITDGVVSTNGTAAFFAIVTSGASRLDVAGPLSASLSVTAGTTFSLAAFDVRNANTGG